MHLEIRVMQSYCAQLHNDLINCSFKFDSFKLKSEQQQLPTLKGERTSRLKQILNN